jgi:hypothetical protein
MIESPFLVDLNFFCKLESLKLQEMKFQKYESTCFLTDSNFEVFDRYEAPFI